MAKPRPAGAVDLLKNVQWTSWLLLLAMLFAAYVRFHLRDIPLERDEGEYAYSGQLMLQGIPPYQLAYNMKLPGTYAAYALIMAISGETSSGIHTGLLILNAATTLLVFALGRKLFGTQLGSLAGSSYALLSLSPAVHGLAAHATHFVVIAAVAGILLLLYALDSDRVALFFWSGTCLGLAFLMKQPGAVFSAFALVYFAYQNRDRFKDWRYVGSLGGALIGGIVWPFAVTCLILYRAGVLTRFWFWTFSYARTYASTVPFGIGVRNLWGSLSDLFWFGGGLWVLAVLGLAVLLWKRKAHPRSGFVAALLAFSFLGVAAGFYFRSHYFILLFPAASLLIAIAVGSSTQFLRDRQFTSRVVFIPAVVFVLAVVISVLQERRFLFAPNGVVASREMYFGNPFVEAESLGKFLRASTPPTVKLAVFGSEPEIYFYAQRHSATGYIYTYGLMEDQRYAPQMQQEMFAEISRARPEYVVFVDDELSWLWLPGGGREAFFKMIQLLINTQYVKTAQVDIAGSPGHLLGDTAKIYVFRRKSQE